MVLANIRGMSRGDAGEEEVRVFEGGLILRNLEATPLTGFSSSWPFDFAAIHLKKGSTTIGG